MAKTTFWDFIERTFFKVKTPLSAREIWDKANELGITKDFKTTGKTPWGTIASYIYTDMNKNGESSVMIQTSESPTQFILRDLADKIEKMEFKEKKLRKKDCFGYKSVRLII